MENNNLNNALNSFVINYITRLYQQRDYKNLQGIGLSKEAAKRVASLSLSDSARLGLFRAQIASIQVTEQHLDMMINHVQREGARDGIIDQMILLGASQAMLFELAGIDNTEFRDRRQALELPKATAGRPAALKKHESTKVHNAWYKHRDQEDILLRYYFIGLDTEIALSRVWHHLQIPDL